MADVKVTWTTTAVTVPAGSDLSQYRARIDGMADVFVPFGTPEVTFPGIAPGDYVARVGLSNADASHIENDRMATFNVPTPTETRDAPDVVSVQIL